MTAPNQPPSGGSSVLKVLGIIFLLLLLLGVVLFGSCMYCVVSNPEVRKASSLMGEAMRMTMEANKAPGTGELRAAGCAEAMVMDMRPLIAKVEELEREGGRANFHRPEEEWQKVTVVCRLDSAESDLDCAAVAKVYGNAVDNAPEMFAVAVQIGGDEPVCQGAFQPDGTLIKEIDHPRGLEPMPLGPGPGRAPAEAEPVPIAPESP